MLHPFKAQWVLLCLPRGNAFGIQAAIGRIGAIVGTLLFGKLIAVSVYLPVLIVASLLLTGGLSVFLLPLRGRLPPVLRGLKRCFRHLLGHF